MKKNILLLSTLLLGMILGSLNGICETNPPILHQKSSSSPIILVWSGNGATHLDVSGLQSNATSWGYTISTNEGTLNADILEAVTVLIVNIPLYLTPSQINEIRDWYTDTPGRTLWIAGDSDYGGYWYPWGTPAEPLGVNHLIREVGGHIYLQDDAVIDKGMNDNAEYRVIANIPNTVEEPAYTITTRVENISLHGPTCVVPYSTVNATGASTMVQYDELADTQWLINTSATGEVVDQDLDADDNWEGYPTEKNTSISVIAIEWNVGGQNNRLVVAGEAFYSEFYSMFDSSAQYVTNLALQNIHLTQQLLEWSVEEQEDSSTTTQTNSSTTTTSTQSSNPSKPTPELTPSLSWILTVGILAFLSIWRKHQN